MKPNLPTSTKKLSATTAVARRGSSHEMEDMEPTMKLSTAFIVVLLLHLIAVGGIFAFKTIKAPGNVSYPEAENKAPVAETTPVPALPSSVAEEKTAPVANAVAAPVAASQPIAKEPAAARIVEVPKKPAGAASGLRDSGLVHTVVKGENPERIARRFGVSYNALIKLNNIDDPTKLRIGQKLRIPAKKVTAAN